MRRRGLSRPPGASVFTVSDAFIFPGFIGQQQESCVGDVEASIRPTFTVSFGRSSCKQLSVYVLRSPC
jgi:hypothetical protein